MEMYSKIIFLNKETEKEWNEAPDCIKRSRQYIIEQNIAEIQRKIQNKISKESN